MRVTNRMIIDSTYQNAAQHLEKMASLQNMLSSGKRVTKPSDDPTAISQAMLLRNTLEDQTQYVRNVGQVANWIDTSDQTVGQAMQVLDRARELAVQGASETQDLNSRKSIAKEIRQLQEQMRGISNTTLVGRTIFGGSQTLSQPYPPFNAPGSPTVYPTPATDPRLDNTDPLSAEIGPQIQIAYNVTGSQVFGATTDPENVFQVLEDLANNLEGDQTSEIGASIDKLERRSETMALARADLGGKRNRIDLLKARYNDTEVGLRDLLSKNEEADMPEVISQLALATSVYQASLAASAKIIQPSLLEFLR